MDSLISVLIGATGCHLSKGSKSSYSHPPSKAFCSPGQCETEPRVGWFRAACRGVGWQSRAVGRGMVLTEPRGTCSTADLNPTLGISLQEPSLWVWTRSLLGFFIPHPTEEKMTVSGTRQQRAAGWLQLPALPLCTSAFLLFFDFFPLFPFQFGTWYKHHSLPVGSAMEQHLPHVLSPVGQLALLPAADSALRRGN